MPFCEPCPFHKQVLEIQELHEEKLSQLPALLEKLGLAAAGGKPPTHSADTHKDRYAFWETQPVPQYNEAASANVRLCYLFAHHMQLCDTKSVCSSSKTNDHDGQIMVVSEKPWRCIT